MGCASSTLSKRARRRCSDNQIRVIFSVQSKYRIEDIIIKGARHITRSRIFKDMKMRVGGVLDDRFLSRDADTILELYREKGYTQATVNYAIERNSETGRGVVTFTINEGRRLEIDKIQFVGNTAFSNGKLRRTIKTKRRWFMSWLIGGGRFDEVEFQEDLEKLRTLYLDEGYLDVSIPESNVTLEYPSKSEILITIRIDEGRRYSVGKVTFEGNELFKSIGALSVSHAFAG